MSFYVVDKTKDSPLYLSCVDGETGEFTMDKSKWTWHTNKMLATIFPLWRQADVAKDTVGEGEVEEDIVLATIKTHGPPESN